MQNAAVETSPQRTRLLSLPGVSYHRSVGRVDRRVSDRRQMLVPA